MALRVPTYEPNQVSTRPVTNAPLTGVGERAFSPAVGEALQGLGKAAGQAGQQVDQIADMQAESLAREVDVEISTAHRKLLWEKDGLMNRQGDDFLNNAAATRKAIEEQSRAFAARGRNSMEKRMLQDVISRRLQPALEGIARGEAKATQDVWRGRTAARVENEIRNGVAAYGDVEAYTASRVQLSSSLLEKREAFGLDPETYKLEQAKAYSQLHVHGISSLLEANDTETAEERFEAALAAGELTPEAATALRKEIVRTKNDAVAETFAMDLEADGLLSPSGLEFGPPLANVPEPSSTYGPRKHPIDGVVKPHTGVDYAVPEGTPVLAAAPGKVVEVAKRGGYGLMVRVDHGAGNETWYAHLSEAGVKVGDTVARGQRLAGSGSSGKATGPHLHFEVRHGGRAVDPSSAPQAVTLETLPAYARERAAGDPKLYKQIMSAGITAISRREAIKREREERLVDEVWKHVEGATSETAIPKGLWNALKPQQRDAFRTQIKQNITGTGETDLGHFGDLMTMLSDKPKDFARYEFETDPKLTREDKRTFIRMRTEVRANALKPAVKTSAETTNRIGELAAPVSLKDDDRKVYKGVLYRAVATAEAASDKPLTEAEIMQIASRLAVDVATQKGKEMPLYQFGTSEKPGMVRYSSIPVADRQRLVRDYQKANGGKTPSQGEVVNAWVSLKARGILP